MTTVDPATTASLARSSIALIVELQTATGAYPASPTFSAYRGYCWFRDGAFIADAASAGGAPDSADAFFAWCTTITEKYRDDMERAIAAAASGLPLPAEQMMPARFTFDGDRGLHDWWDFQLDGYGTWLWALEQHIVRQGGDPRPYANAVDLTVRYLASSWSRPCFDWWEESADRVHISTLGCVGAGLESALSLGVLSPATSEAATTAAEEIRSLIMTSGIHDGHLVKSIGSVQVDGSLSALIAPLGYIEPTSTVAIATIDAIQAELDIDGGVHRYLDDTFYGGGQWPLLTCFLGLAQAATGDGAGARAALDWAVSTATPGGELPEQVPGHLLSPARRQEWIEKWGPVATPLVWSHAMVARLHWELSA